MDALLGGATSDRVRNTDEVVLLLAGCAHRTFVKFWNWIANDECGDANENFDSFFWRGSKWLLSCAKDTDKVRDLRGKWN